MPYVHVNGQPLHYLEEGEGPPLVWLPGGNDCAELMLHAHRPLTTRVRLIAYDPRGQGRSFAPVTADDYAPEAHLHDLAGFLDALGLRRIIMGGHSRGGRTSVEFALTFPDRIRGVIAAASPLLGFTPERGVRFRLYQEALRNEGVDAFLEKLGTGPRNPERRAIWREAAHHAGPDALIAQYNALARLPPLTDRLAGLAMPALFVTGDRDHMLDHARVAAAACPTAELVILDNAGHAVFADNQPDYFTAFNRFLDRVLDVSSTVPGPRSR